MLRHPRRLADIPALSPHWGTTLVTVALLIMTGFHVACLMRFPLAFVDEAWMASKAWGWLQTGLNFGTLDAGPHEQLSGYWTFAPILPTLIHAGAIRLLGLSLASLRVASLLAGLALLGAVYVVARELAGSQRGGLIAVLLVSTSFAFTYSSHLVRPDIFVATLGFGAIALYLVGQRKGKAVFGLLSGLAVGAAFEMHVNAVIYGPIILALFLVDDGWRCLRTRTFLAFALGVTLGLGAYAWLHVLRYPETYLTMGGKLGETHMPPLFTGHILGMLWGLAEMGPYLLSATFDRILGTVAAAVGLYRHGRAASRRPLTLLIVGLLCFGLFIRAKIGYYAILIVPLTDIVIAVWIDRMLGAWSALSPWGRRGQAALYSLILVTAVIVGYIAVTAPRPGGHKVVADRIAGHLGPDGSLMGAQTYWFELYEHPYYSWQQINAYRRLHPGSTVSEAMNSMRPDLLVIDDHLRAFIVSDPLTVDTYAWERRIPPEEMDAFLSTYGTLVDDFEDPVYGHIEIYALQY